MPSSLLQRLLRLACLSCLCAMLLAVATPAGAQELKRATLLPQWTPQAQFAGIYAAKDLGIYEKYGVNMRVLRGGPDASSSLLLATGDVDFSTMFLTTAVKLASQGERIVNLAQLVQHSSLLLVAKKSRGILTPKDMMGKRISSWGPEFFVQIEEFMRKRGIEVEVLPQSGTVNLFLRDAVCAASAMLYNEYHTILNSGLDKDDLTVFAMADYDLSYPEDGLYCTRSTYERDPELACAVARATLEGWRWAFEHPEEALDMVMRRVEGANLATNRVHQRWMLARMKDIMLPGSEQFGMLDRDAYLSVAGSMQKAELIGTYPTYEEFHVQCSTAP